jgi:endonuclease-3
MPVTTRRTLTSATFFTLGQQVNGKRTRPTFTTAAMSMSNESSPPTKVVKQEAQQSPSTPAPHKKSTKSTPRKKIITPEPGSREPPKGWEVIYSLVEELRSDRTAPVDDNGSEALPQRELGEKVFRFQVLIALMLSSQTKDQVVGDAMRALQQHGLTVENISATDPETLNKLIQRVGFHNNKTKYIKQVVEILKGSYDCDIPPNAEEIMKLPGVGPKMAFIVENVAWKKSTGIGIDTHMHRMFNELGWVKSNNPEQTRGQLESWLPREKWDSVNLLWVGFGQEVQQFKPKMLEKALNCSQPMEALRLIKRLGLDCKKEAIKAGLEEKLNQVVASGKSGK